MEKSQYKTQMRAKRHNRLRHKVSGTAARPRLAVFRSNKFVYAQLIDDTAGKTIASADSRKGAKGTAVEKAKAVGTEIAKKAKDAKIETVVFDRGGFQYAGIVAALADAAREGGLRF
ncbi:MAG: 50S ribosomal protein L18 [Candidatus Kaiserbacteria bacterium]|nr:50S ribosomal protein L18 [Candidatus Kaiserbacteria bacterium]MCB9816709.1 50S ribosomal protein L18 [Candidatus Nomurabacteria bacterium]